MTRGKYANTSEARRAREGAIARADRLQRDLARATARADDLAAELDREKLRALDEATKLRQQIAANTSSKLAVKQRQLDTAVASLREIEGVNRKVRESHKKLFERVCDHFIIAHGWTGADAVQAIAEELGAEGYVADDLHMSKFSVDQAYQLEKAKGKRTTKNEPGQGFNTETVPW